MSMSAEGGFAAVAIGTTMRRKLHSGSNGRGQARGSGAHSGGEAGHLEDEVVRLATQGKLAGAARRAIRRQFAKGGAITFKRGTRVIKRHEDGREEFLGNVARARYSLPANV